MPSDAIAALTRLGGVASPAEVRRLASRRRLRTAIRRGEVIRLPGRDLVALTTAENDRLLATRHGGSLSHLSAALAHGWAVAEVPEQPWVTIPHHLALPDAQPEDVTLLRRRLPAADVTGWCTAPLRTVLDCARDLDFSEALVVADSALRSGALTYDDLVRAASKLRGPGAKDAQRVAAYADGRSANAFESELRAICIEVGLDVVPQWELRSNGLVLHPDMADPNRGIAVEADSWEHHGKARKDWARDVVRYNALTMAGWRIVRFTWEQVRFNKGYVRTVVAALLEPGQAT